MRIIKYSLTCFLALFVCVFIFEAVKVVNAMLKTPEIRLQFLSEKAIEVELEDIPKNWVDILIKIEDPNFYNHEGVDIFTPGAGLTTITQAMTKYMYFDNFKPGFAKLEQSLIAYFVVNSSFSKEEQLTIFYSSAYLGHHKGAGVRGFPNASRVYYNKGFNELSEDEYISLVAMLVSPKSFNIVKNPENNRKRVGRIKRVLSGGYQPASVSDIMYDRDV